MVKITFIVKFDLGFGKSIRNKWRRLNLDLPILVFWKNFKKLKIYFFRKNISTHKIFFRNSKLFYPVSLVRNNFLFKIDFDFFEIFSPNSACLLYVRCSFRIRGQTWQKTWFYSFLKSENFVFSENFQKFEVFLVDRERPFELRDPCGSLTVLLILLPFERVS